DEGGKPAVKVVREMPVPSGVTVDAVEDELAPGRPETGAKHEFAWSATRDELAALDAMTKDGTWTVGGFELKLTNLDKVIFPPRADDAPVTKRDLVRYFAQIAPVMLPHLQERALNFQRFPNGPNAPGFWQKDIPSTAPAWLRRWKE